MRFLLALLCLSLVVAPVAWRASQEAGGSGGRRSRGSTSVAVEVAPVEVAPIRELVELTGSLETRATFTVASKVGGRLETLGVEAGDPLTQGQEVARLEDDEYLQRVEQARAEVEVARAREQASRSLVEYARRDLGRITTLAERSLVADTELDAARSKLESLRAEGAVNRALLTQSEAALKAAQVQLDYTHVHALWEDEPLERLVGERFVEEGTLLSPGQAMISVIDIDALDAVVTVIERDYARITRGQAATLSTDAFPGETFAGTVRLIAPLLQESSRQARVEVRVPNPDHRLRPGMFVRVELELSRREQATVVPRGALVSRGGKRSLFLLDREAGLARQVDVEVGIVAADRVEIRSPEISGEVVTVGQHLLSGETAVTVAGKRAIP